MKWYQEVVFTPVFHEGWANWARAPELEFQMWNFDLFLFSRALWEVSSRSDIQSVICPFVYVMNLCKFSKTTLIRAKGSSVWVYIIKDQMANSLNTQSKGNNNLYLRITYDYVLSVRFAESWAWGLNTFMKLWKVKKRRFQQCASKTSGHSSQCERHWLS